MISVSDEVVGIISGGSSVYSVRARDNFFGIPKEKQEKEKQWLPSIVNNTVFRLEDQAEVHNLGTQTLRIWRKAMAIVWYQMYGVRVIGFETFVIPSERRTGSMYKADNWHDLGMTSGRTKQHITAKGLSDKRAYVDTEEKIILTRWAKKPMKPEGEYVSCWRRSTPEEKNRAKALSSSRLALVGSRFDIQGVLK